MDDFRRLIILGNTALINNKHTIRNRERFLRIMGYDDCCQMVFPWLSSLSDP